MKKRFKRNKDLLNCWFRRLVDKRKKKSKPESAPDWLSGTVAKLLGIR